MPFDTAEAWSAVLQRDRSFDGVFVYAVASTAIYCRPSCPSRRPGREQVTFYPSSLQAESAGYRACLRCRPQIQELSRMDEIVHRVGRYLNDHAEERVTLRSLADHLGISPWHLQRTFRSRVGLSPKRYHDALRVRRFKAHLKRGQTVTQATYEAGFGSGSRVYERVAPAIGMTPGTFRAGGKGVTLRYATMPTEVGELLVAATERGVVSVSLGDDEASLVKMLKEEFPHATVRRDRQGLNHDVRTIQYGLRGTGKIGLLLDVKTTAFQRKVWQALQEIPRGQTRSYREVAEMIGLPTASRAVARACATNPIAVAIPCHRVVRADGRPAGYRWGIQRKKQLLALELLGLGLIFSPSPPRIAPFVRARDLAADYPNLGDASFMAPIRQSLFAVLMSSAMLSAPLLVLPAPFAEAARGGGRTEVLPAQKSAPSVVAIDRTASEDDLRKEMREKNSVGELSANGQFSQAPTGRFGFIAPRMLGMALVTQSPDLGLSRTPQDKAAFEVHKLADGSGMLVGFVARDQLSELTSAQRPKTLRIALHSNASEKAPVIVAVPIVKLMADRMPFKLDPQGHGGPMVIDMDLQGTANRQKTQGGP